jgi:aspartate aminotransferase, cytoplasmic
VNTTVNKELQSTHIIAYMALLAATSFPADVVPLAIEDPNSRLKAACRADKDARKVDLSIRFYRDDNAEQWVLPVVKMAEEILRNDSLPDHEYLPIAGLAEFTSAAVRLILGANSPAIREERVSHCRQVSS